LVTISGSKRVGRIRARNKVTADARATIATKALAYVRVSTDEQAAHGHGLDVQERAVKAFAESQGYDLADVIRDPGVSGATRPADRPGFGRILELAGSRSFSVLIVYRFDRLAREIRYAVTTASDLAEQYGVGIRSVTEPIDTATSAGKMMFAVLAAMAEAERDVITERTKGGRIAKATDGGYACGRVPYGYEHDREGGLRVVPEQAAIVRRIFRERRQLKLKEIAAGLNRDGIAAPKGGEWQVSSVAYVLDNPRYRGVSEYLFRSPAGETHVLRDGVHAAIV
jgi:site-specific DNA recombinase